MVVVGLAIALQWACTPLLGPEEIPFLFLFPAIVAVAWYGGTGPALVAVALGTLLTNWFFVSPVGSLWVDKIGAVYALLVFALVALCIAGAIEAMHRANARARAELARRDQADAALRESEARFRTMADGLPLMIWVHDASGMQQFVNRRFCEFFGVQLDEMTGTRWELLLHPEDVAAYNAEFQRCVARREHFHAETRVRRGDGQWRFIECWARPRSSSTGEFLGFVGASADVTDRKASEAALYESQQRLQLALAGAGMGVWTWNVETDAVEWSPEVYQLCGVDRFAGTLDGFFKLVHSEDRARIRQVVHDALAMREPYSAEFRIVRPDESIRWVHDRGRMEHASDGKPRRMLGVMLDITERRKAQEQLELARDQALAANRAKDQFLAALSHELRTPLTPALVVSAELEHSPAVPVDIREQCATVRASIELEARLIDDLLDVARMTQGKMHMVFGRCEAHAMLRQAVEIVQSEFTAKQIHLDWELDLAEARIAGAAVRLQQVLWNLLRNAAKFTPCAGAVRLRTRVAGGTWRLEVVDTGIGIAAADHARIFEIFVQCDSAPQPQLRGLGLGLSISAFIVQEHGGRIWAESAGLGQGATFVLELPLAATTIQEEPDAGTPAPRQQRALRILLVEDHAPTRSALAALLGRRGHTVVAAAGVVRARAEAASREFDVVLSDVGLADGSGLQLMRELRQAHGLCGIALSGYAMESDIQSAIEAGFLMHLSKPVKLQRLDEALARVSELLCARVH